MGKGATDAASSSSRDQLFANQRRLWSTRSAADRDPSAAADPGVGDYGGGTSKGATTSVRNETRFAKASYSAAGGVGDKNGCLRVGRSGGGRILLDGDTWDDIDSRSSLRVDTVGDGDIEECLGRNNYGFEGDAGDEEAQSVTVEAPVSYRAIRPLPPPPTAKRLSVGSAKASIVSIGKDEKGVTATTTLGDTITDAGDNNINIDNGNSRINPTDHVGAALAYPLRNRSRASFRKRIRPNGNESSNGTARPQSYSAIEHFNSSNQMILGGSGRGLRASYAGETTCRDWGVAPVLRGESIGPDGGMSPRGIVVNWVDR